MSRAPVAPVYADARLPWFAQFEGGSAKCRRRRRQVSQRQSALRNRWAPRAARTSDSEIVVVAPIPASDTASRAPSPSLPLRSGPPLPNERDARGHPLASRFLLGAGSAGGRIAAGRPRVERPRSPRPRDGPRSAARGGGAAGRPAHRPHCLPGALPGRLGRPRSLRAGSPGSTSARAATRRASSGWRSPSSSLRTFPAAPNLPRPAAIRTRCSSWSPARRRRAFSSFSGLFDVIRAVSEGRSRRHRPLSFGKE